MEQDCSGARTGPQSLVCTASPWGKMEFMVELPAPRFFTITEIGADNVPICWAGKGYAFLERRTKGKVMESPVTAKVWLLVGVEIVTVPLSPRTVTWHEPPPARVLPQLFASVIVAVMVRGVVALPTLRTSSTGPIRGDRLIFDASKAE